MKHKKSSRPETYKPSWDYEVALYRGDEQIDSGTVREVAERRGVQKRTILFHTMPSGIARAMKRQDQSTSFYVVRIDE